MKGLFRIACSVAMLGIYLASHAQTQDPALARIDEGMKEKTPKSHEVEIPAPAESAYPTSAEFVAPASPVNRTSAEWILQHKVGPYGEDIMQENSSFYYIDGAGQRVDVKLSDLKDKPKSS